MGHPLDVAAALLLTLAVPAAVRVIGTQPATLQLVRWNAAPADTRGAAPPSAAKPAAAPTAAVRRAGQMLRETLDPAALQRPLTALWIASSAAVIAVLAAMGYALRRRCRGWTAVEVDGVPVLVSDDTGPAVVGLLRSRIVLPRWVLEADAEARALMLEHEREHLRAGDPRLLAAALIAVVLTPWNPAAWWLLRRLRMAVEVDCDARVLRRRTDVVAYGTVLLEVGRRVTRARLAGAIPFGEPASALERRIRIMTAPRPGRPLLRAAGFASVAAALAAAACETPLPMQPTPDGTRQLAGAPGSFARSGLTPRMLLERYYPHVLREGVRQGDVITFELDADGRVVAHEYQSPSQGLTMGSISPAQRAEEVASVNVIKSRPGELGPTAVSMIVVQLRRNAAQGPQQRRPSAPPLPPRAEIEQHHRQLDAAIARHYPPLYRDAGITAEMRLRITVGSDGRARDVVVTAGDPRFAEAARAVARDLRFAPGSGTTWLTFQFGSPNSAVVRP